MSKILIAFFSHSGTTRRAAETVQKAVGGKLYEIEPKNAYPASYNEVLAIAKKEKESEARPALKNDPGAEIKGIPSWSRRRSRANVSFLLPPAEAAVSRVQTRTSQQFARSNVKKDICRV